MADDDPLAFGYPGEDQPISGWSTWAPPGQSRGIDFGIPPGASAFPEGDPRNAQRYRDAGIRGPAEPPPPPGQRYGPWERIAAPDVPLPAPANTTVVPKDSDVTPTPGRVTGKKGEKGDVRPPFDPTIGGTRPAGVRGDRGAPPPDALKPGAGPAGGQGDMYNQLLQMLFQLMQRRMQGGGGMPGMGGMGGGSPFGLRPGQAAGVRNLHRHMMNSIRTNAARNGLQFSTNVGQQGRWADDVAMEAADRHMHNNLQDWMQYQNFQRGEEKQFMDMIQQFLYQLVRNRGPGSTYSPPAPTTTNTTPTGPATASSSSVPVTPVDPGALAP